ncbi:MAG: cell division protein FtsQ/DivIB [Actinomycetota bacterium]
MDPRIAARRSEVRRASSRRRTRILLGIGTALAAIGLAWVALRSSLFDVDTVRVDTTTHVPAEAVIVASGVQAGDALAFVDTAAVARRVDRLPWVDEVTVRREWPGAIRIRVTEHRPVLVVRDGRTVALVADDGRAFARQARVPPRVRELRGIGRLPAPGESVVAPGIARLAANLPAPLAARTVAVDVGDGGYALVLADGGEVRLGSVDELAAKAAAAAAVLRASPGVCIRYVDVTAADAPVRREC